MHTSESNAAGYRSALPQLGDELFLTDAGLETTLIFHDGLELPYFAAFHLLQESAGTDSLRRYFRRYVSMAASFGIGAVLESPTWRANRDWAARLGYDARSLAEANRKSIQLLQEVRAVVRPGDKPIVISGNVGPRGDGYRPDMRMKFGEARDYHAPQIAGFAETAADMVAAFTMNYVEEGIGIALAARDTGMPVAISFTVETDGCLPSGQSLGDAIEQTDDATGEYPAYYMINCAHPTHFSHVLERGGEWRNRVRGLRANASRRSHAELDAAPDLDVGNPDELGDEYRDLRDLLPQITVVGGCCGTDDRHIAAICRACQAS